MAEGRPPEVVAAAHRLARRRDRRGVTYFGAMAAVVQDDWAAFVTAAPFAVEATVYDVRGPAIAELTDKGTTPVLYLRSEQHRALLEDVDPSLCTR